MNLRHMLKPITPMGRTVLRSEDVAAVQFPDSRDKQVIIILKGGYWFCVPQCLENADALMWLEHLL